MKLTQIVLGIFICCSIYKVNTICASGSYNLPDPLVLKNFAVDTTPVKGASKTKVKNPFDLKDPKIVEKSIEYDPITGEYILEEKIGSDNYTNPTSYSFEQYLRNKARQEDRDYYKNLAGISTGQHSKTGRIDPVTKIEIKRNLVDKLFGGLGVEIKPQGSVDVTLGGYYNFDDYINSTSFQNSQSGFDFDMDIQMDVTGSIGDKLKLNTNYNTGATFDFENKLKLEYDSEKFSEDDIIKKIEAGNVSLPLRSSLIQGSQNLFGFKTEWQFGHLRLTGVVSQQKSKQDKLQVKGGGVEQEFEIRPDEYDENRHFFLSHYNRNNFEPALAALPEIRSLFKVRDIEVWITEDAPNSRETNTRDIVALTDIATPASFPFDFIQPNKFLPGTSSTDNSRTELYTNDANTIYKTLTSNPTNRELNKVVSVLTSLGLEQGRDFEKVRAKKLNSNEFTFNPDLGFISLKVRPRPNQVVAVSYYYTYAGKDEHPRSKSNYKVGEFSHEVHADSLNGKVLFVKMLKSSTQSPALKSWDLMMKNVYSIGGFNIGPNDFTLDVFYEGDKGVPKRFIQEVDGFPLLNLFRLDNLNSTGDPQPDGVFDFVPGLTIIPSNGSIIFPVLEPFGRSLRPLLLNLEELKVDTARANQIYEKYNYEDLYKKSVTSAKRTLSANQFLIKGKQKSTNGSEINLGVFNLQRGSVRVTAGAQQLKEDIDYTVDYSLGRVKIINDAVLQSGAPIDVGFEDNSLFSFQTKTMIGLRAEYALRKDMHIGGTYMHLYEKPFTQKVNIGEDPINNRIVGLDFGISKSVPWITRALDKLPLYQTKADSKINIETEGAVLIPGHSKAINQQSSDGGVVYVDDFEGSVSGIYLDFGTNQWQLASIPQGMGTAFPESELNNTVATGVNRALINWYSIDEYARSRSQLQDHPYTRLIDEKEIFPTRDRLPGQNFRRTFDLSYYPKIKGPYNYETPTGVSLGNNLSSAGLNKDNTLKSPESRWGGLMYRLSNNDFEQANIEFIDFWLLNPFMSKPDNSPISADGEIMLQLGTFSEDIFKDSRQQYEHGLPTTNLYLPTDKTSWGKIARTPPIVSGFNGQDYDEQDVGFDGLNDEEEVEFHNAYSSTLQPYLDPNAFNEYISDPGNDNFISPTLETFDPQTATILDRYKKFNNPQGNTTRINKDDPFERVYSATPDQEDLNNDKSLNETESYFNFRLPIKNNGSGALAFDPNDPENFITDVREVTRQNGPSETWYRVRIPLNSLKRESVGQINDFRSIQFIRLVTKGFDESITFRLFEFQLGRNTWRKYNDICLGDRESGSKLVVDKVDIEENKFKRPFNYTLPPGIQRERFYSSSYADQNQNESSLLLKRDSLEPNCQNSIYKIIDLDFRRYKRIKMFVHAESNDIEIKRGDAAIVVRLGKDFTNNYYEYEIPLQVSDLFTLSQKQDSIWLKENEVDFPLELLTKLKEERNKQNFPISQFFEMKDPEKPDNTVRIIGNPSLALVRGALIGVKNKKNEILEHIEVWINELRLTGLEESGGYAGLARVELQLADLGSLNLSGNYASVGWGAIDQKLVQRSLESNAQYDITTSLEIGKFLPKKSGIKLPFYAQYSRNVKIPKYDPSDTDLKLKDKINTAGSRAQKDSIRDLAIEQVSIKSFNFTNVRKERTGQGKPKPWNIENIALGYSQTITEKSSPVVAQDNQKAQVGTVDYTYALTPKYIEPFKKIVKSPYLKLVSDLNLNLIPSSFTMRNNLDRKFSVRTYRFAAPKYSTWEESKFGWTRDYTLNWELTRLLKLNYSASNYSVIDEILYNPLRQGYVDPKGNLRTKSDQTKYTRENLGRAGRTTDYKHTAGVSYTLPFKNIPMMDWVNSRVQYNTSFNWAGGSFVTVDSLGSVISNTQNVSISGEFNFVNLYNKSKFLKRITGDARPTASRQKPSTPDRNPADKNAKKEKSEKSSTTVAIWEKILIRPLLSIKRIQLNYSQNKGTTIPGFMQSPELFGMNDKFNAPGWDFVFGAQPSFDKNAWLDRAASKGWISSNAWFSQDMLQLNGNTFGIKAKLEPIKDLNIDLNVDRTYTKDLKESFRYDSVIGTQNLAFQHASRFENGNYTISFVSIQSLFNNDIDAVFKQFSENRPAISKRVGKRNRIEGEHLENPEYNFGYGGDHIDVVLPAFLAAYTNTSVDKVNLDIFKTIPLPNWQVNYNGLSKIGFFKNIFTDIAIRHGYKNTLSVNNFNTDLDFEANDINQPLILKDDSKSYYAQYDIPEVNVNESFSPLVGINIKTKNDMDISFDFMKSRTLNLTNSINGQMREGRSTGMTFSYTYRIKNVYLPFIPGVEKVKKAASKIKKDEQTPGSNTTKPKGNELEITCSMGWKDDISLVHRLDANRTAEIERGSKRLTISPAVKYNINKNLNARLFVDYSRTVPYVFVTTFKTINIDGGLTIQFILN